MTTRVGIGAAYRRCIHDPDMGCISKQKELCIHKAAQKKETEAGTEVVYRKAETRTVAVCCILPLELDSRIGTGAVYRSRDRSRTQEM